MSPKDQSMSDPEKEMGVLLGEPSELKRFKDDPKMLR